MGVNLGVMDSILVQNIQSKIGKLLTEVPLRSCLSLPPHNSKIHKPDLVKTHIKGQRGKTDFQKQDPRVKAMALILL